MKLKKEHPPKIRILIQSVEYDTKEKHDVSLGGKHIVIHDTKESDLNRVYELIKNALEENVGDKCKLCENKCEVEIEFYDGHTIRCCKDHINFYDPKNVKEIRGLVKVIGLSDEKELE